MKPVIRASVALSALLFAVIGAAPAVGHFYNVRFQRCLDADTNTGGNGGKVQLWDCGPWNQQWWENRAG